MGSSLAAGLLLTILREFMMNSTQPISAFIVPNSDEHLTGGLANCDARLAFISNYTGSAGTAIITLDSANLWTDGRYFTQASDQLDPEHWTLMRQGEAGVPTQSEWLKTHLNPNTRIAIDPKLYSNTAWELMSSDLSTSDKNLQLVELETNWIDLIWADEKPPCSQTQIYKHPIEFAGKSSSEKLTQIRSEMLENEADILVISELDQISWTLNLRAFDFPYSIQFRGFLIILHDSFELFSHISQFDKGILDEIAQIGGIFYPYEEFYNRVKYHSSISGKIWLSKHANRHLVNQVIQVDPVAFKIVKLTPISLLKSLKNPAEVKGLFDCHVRDGSALVQFLAWAEESLKNGDFMTELSASAKLRDYRKILDHFEELSFQAIMASGPNSAMAHYMPTEKTNRNISIDEILLVDSGGLYLDGITDVTRTVHFSEPTEFQKNAFTRVLKGQIALRHAFFPLGYKAQFLDPIARQHLWGIGLDYNHGTGHGMAAVWPSIGSNSNPDDPGLFENMFVSDEPGFYEENNFGIRLENVIKTVKAETPYNFGNKTYLTFEDVTYVPIQTKMIQTELLTSLEINYINEYHAKCREIIGNYLLGKLSDQRAYNWLLKETEPLSPNFSASTSLNNFLSFKLHLSLVTCGYIISYYV